MITEDGWHIDEQPPYDREYWVTVKNCIGTKFVTRYWYTRLGWKIIGTYKTTEQAGIIAWQPINIPKPYGV